MVRLVVTFIAACGAYLGIHELWSGCKAAAFIYEGFPFSWQLLATILAVVLALCVGR